jgi:hypothetical protein
MKMLPYLTLVLAFGSIVGCSTTSNVVRLHTGASAPGDISVLFSYANTGPRFGLSLLKSIDGVCLSDDDRKEGKEYHLVAGKHSLELETAGTISVQLSGSQIYELRQVWYWTDANGRPITAYDIAEFLVESSQPGSPIFFDYEYPPLTYSFDVRDDKLMVNPSEGPGLFTDSAGRSHVSFRLESGDQNWKENPKQAKARASANFVGYYGVTNVSSECACRYDELTKGKTPQRLVYVYNRNDRTTIANNNEAVFRLLRQSIDSWTRPENGLGTVGALRR